MNNNMFACPRLHFRRLVFPWTDPSLGNCSYLDTCRHMKTCRYIHYEINDEADLVTPETVARQDRPPVPNYLQVRQDGSQASAAASLTPSCLPARRNTHTCKAICCIAWPGLPAACACVTALGAGKHLRPAEAHMCWYQRCRASSAASIRGADPHACRRSRSRSGSRLTSARST